MSTPKEHPLENLYQTREELEAAVRALRTRPPELISDELCCYAVVNISILHDYRTLVNALAEKADVGRPTIRAAYVDMQEVIARLDELIAFVQRHKATVDDLARQ